MDQIGIAKISRYLERIKHGDHKTAVEELYALMRNQIRFIALRYAKNNWDADDLVQDFWVRVVTYAEHYHGGNGYFYLCKCFTNYCMDWSRKKNRQPEMINIGVLDEFEVAIDEEATARQVDVQKVFANAASMMTERERIVYALIVYEGKPVRDIAKVLGLSKTEISRTRKSVFQKISIALQKMGWDKNDL